jgi:soluble lytic murein transglycosylase-like protein
MPYALAILAVLVLAALATRRAQAATTASDFLKSITGGLTDDTTQKAITAAAQKWDIPQARQEMTWQTPPRGLAFESLFLDASRAYGLPAGLLSRIAYQESRYDPLAQSPKGAQGIMQFMPATARDFSVDPFDVGSSIWGAAKYLSELRAKFGNWREAIAAYNWGQGNVQRQGLDAAPKETRDYLDGIAANVDLTS